MDKWSWNNDKEAKEEVQISMTMEEVIKLQNKLQHIYEVVYHNNGFGIEEPVADEIMSACYGTEEEVRTLYNKVLNAMPD